MQVCRVPLLIAVMIVLCTSFLYCASAQPIEDGALTACLQECEKAFPQDASGRSGCTARCKTENHVDTLGQKAASAAASGLSQADSALKFLKGYFSIGRKSGARPTEQ